MQQPRYVNNDVDWDEFAICTVYATATTYE